MFKFVVFIYFMFSIETFPTSWMWRSAMDGIVINVRLNSSCLSPPCGRLFAVQNANRETVRDTIVITVARARACRWRFTKVKLVAKRIHKNVK